ncbi:MULTISPECIES: histidine phosphatase family protein [Desulfitobacterium]|uniref:Fructose-2,6-bisphosphatase n=1 Tax=Desulfitobacterium dehalogenans (strain ATCC 51507 / DSM 9161 / JW/IU-DC1) TaxID=756499 RepID=I4AA04_DESDJ|nr:MULTISPECIES: histidine phosphatase family protein [Desulfitobacterium]AFM00789.1 fructose-2,6-bisphosphatase [Desulfitobacterium dehalogenans ATCC 51507]
MIKIILTRHGETLWNIEGRVQGALDSPLTEKGVQQARKVGQRLQKEGITRIYSSDLPRAQATADEIRKALGVEEILLDPALRELSFGEWEGKNWWDLRQRYPEMFTLWDTGPHQVQIPGAESMWEVSERAWQFVQELPRLHDGETLCVVTHGMTLQLIVKKALGIPVEQWNDVPWQHNTAVNIFEFYEDGRIHPILLADHTHLDDDIKSASGFNQKRKPE